MGMKHRRVGIAVTAVLCFVTLTGCARIASIGAASPKSAADYIGQDPSVHTALVHETSISKTFADSYYADADINLRTAPKDPDRLLNRALQAAWATRMAHHPEGVFIHVEGPGRDGFPLDAEALAAAGWPDAIADDGNNQDTKLVLVQERFLEQKWGKWPGKKPVGL
ncbi:hypothetical protein ACWGJ9_10445 [Curtobacterium citreum]